MNEEKKKTWILMRGLIRESRHWHDFPAHLQKYDPEAEIIFIDLPGAGSARSEHCPARVSAITDLIRQRTNIQEENFAQRDCYLIAMSLGGMIAMDWQSRYPQEINGSVLINSSAASLSPFYHRLRPQQWLRILLILLLGSWRQEEIILAMTCNRPERRAEVLPQWKEWLRSSGISIRNAFCQILAASRFRAPIKKQQEKILVLRSLADRLVCASTSLVLANHFQAPLLSHPSAGHDLTLDDPSWCAKAVTDWRKKK